MAYAKNTTVSPVQSQGEIRQILNKVGATKYLYYEEDQRAAIQFELYQRRVRFILPLPSRNEQRFWQTPQRHRRRTDAAAQEAWEQACRESWRALALAIKSKLVTVASKIATFEEEFLANIVMPDGKTVQEHVIPAIQQAYETQTMPKLLPGITGEN